MLLVKKAVGSSFPSLANSINHSKLKKRITMMYKSKSGAGSKLKALALVPIVALAFGVASVPTIKAAVSAISDSEVTFDRVSEKSAVTGKFRIISMNNSGIETAIVVKGEYLGNNLSVSGGTLTNNGKTYSAKSLNTNMTNGAATITAVFPFSESYENVCVAFNIGGRDVKLNLEDFRKNSHTHTMSNSPSKDIVISNGKTTSPTVENMDIYLDDKKISESEMMALNPETIGLMSIDKQKNTINITSK